MPRASLRMAAAASLQSLHADGMASSADASERIARTSAGCFGFAGSLDRSAALDWKSEMHCLTSPADARSDLSCAFATPQSRSTLAEASVRVIVRLMLFPPPVARRNAPFVHRQSKGHSRG